MAAKYGSLFYKLPKVMYKYTEEDLKPWSNFELSRMHYYLTMKLDGYGHLTADDSIKDNCKLFRKILADRGIDAVWNVVDNEYFYDWGYRDYIGTYHKLDETSQERIAITNSYFVMTTFG